MQSFRDLLSERVEVYFQGGKKPERVSCEYDRRNRIDENTPRMFKEHDDFVTINVVIRKYSRYASTVYIVCANMVDKLRREKAIEFKAQSGINPGDVVMFRGASFS